MSFKKPYKGLKLHQLIPPRNLVYVWMHVSNTGSENNNIEAIMSTK